MAYIMCVSEPPAVFFAKTIFYSSRVIGSVSTEIAAMAAVLTMTIVIASLLIAGMIKRIEYTEDTIEEGDTTDDDENVSETDKGEELDGEELDGEELDGEELEGEELEEAAEAAEAAEESTEEVATEVAEESTEEATTSWSHQDEDETDDEHLTQNERVIKRLREVERDTRIRNEFRRFYMTRSSHPD